MYLLQGASHVLSIIHDILAHHRQLETKWHQKKIKLHQRLALRLFQVKFKFSLAYFLSLKFLYFLDYMYSFSSCFKNFLAWKIKFRKHFIVALSLASNIDFAQRKVWGWRYITNYSSFLLVFFITFFNAKLVFVQSNLLD